MSQSQPEYDVDEVIELAVQEMGKRMADDKLRADVPNHVLIKFLAEANKSADRKLAAKEREAVQQAQRDEIEVILNSDLPSEKKRALLEAALHRGEKRLQNIRELLQRGEI